AGTRLRNEACAATPRSALRVQPGVARLLSGSEVRRRVDFACAPPADPAAGLGLDAPAQRSGADRHHVVAQCQVHRWRGGADLRRCRARAAGQPRGSLDSARRPSAPPRYARSRPHPLRRRADRPLGRGDRAGLRRAGRTIASGGSIWLPPCGERPPAGSGSLQPLAPAAAFGSRPLPVVPSGGPPARPCASHRPADCPGYTRRGPALAGSKRSPFMTRSPAAGTPAPPRQWWLISGRRGRLCALAAVAILLAFWGAMASFGPGGVAALRHRLSAGSGRGSVPPALAGRLGDTVASFDRRYLLAGIGVESHAAGDAYRRVYMIPEGRVVAEVLPDGRIRQLTIGRLRHVQQTWEPEAGDWSLQEARQIAVRWLPADAVVIGS